MITHETRLNMIALIPITIVLAALFAYIERRAIDNNIKDGLFADLDHKELTAWRIVSWMVSALVLIAIDAMMFWDVVAVIPASMAAFAFIHRIAINGLRKRPFWYLGVGSWYDRKLIEMMLRLNKDHEDLRLITSAQHYNRIANMRYYKETVRNAGFLAYGIEMAVVLVTLVIRSRLG